VAVIGETTPTVRVILPATPEPALAGQGAASAVIPALQGRRRPSLSVLLAGTAAVLAIRTQDRKIGAAPDQIPGGLAIEESLGQPSSGISC